VSKHGANRAGYASRTRHHAAQRPQEEQPLSEVLDGPVRERTVRGRCRFALTIEKGGEALPGRRAKSPLASDARIPWSASRRAGFSAICSESPEKSRKRALLALCGKGFEEIAGSTGRPFARTRRATQTRVAGRGDSSPASRAPSKRRRRLFFLINL
jgi:hypothetical protein